MPRRVKLVAHACSGHLFWSSIQKIRSFCYEHWKKVTIKPPKLKSALWRVKLVAPACNGHLFWSSILKIRSSCYVPWKKVTVKPPQLKSALGRVKLVAPACNGHLFWSSSLKIQSFCFVHWKKWPSNHRNLNPTYEESSCLHMLTVVIFLGQAF